MANNSYYTNQVITYLGNKRSLIKYIEKEIKHIIDTNYDEVGKNNLVLADLFSGSGVVARMLKMYSKKLIVNDFEPYSKIINQCYLTNKEDFDEQRFEKLLNKIKKQKQIEDGIIRTYYSPKDDKKIIKEDRCFYSNANAKRIDSYRFYIDRFVSDDLKPFFIAPLLYEASVHVNTGGMFKGFYKDKNTRIGKFGGTFSDSLKRIKGTIRIQKPILSDYDADVEIYCEDTNKLILELTDTIDIAYLDPPYNGHSYGSNYFMLNTILQNRIDEKLLSKISGIPNNWQRSDYYKLSNARDAMEKLINNIKAKWIIVSYNSNGIIRIEDLANLLQQYSCEKIKVVKIPYITLKSGRNRKENHRQVTEYLFVCKKGVKEC